MSEAEGRDTQGEAKELLKVRMSQIQDGEPWESQMGKPTLLGKEQALEEREENCPQKVKRFLSLCEAQGF